MLLSVASMLGLQGWRTLLNNFAVDKAHISGEWIGLLQSIREVPGFLCLSVVFILYFFKEQKLVIHTTVIVGIGVALTGFFPNKYGLIVTILIMSIGFHFFETTKQSLILQSFDSHDTATVLGRLRSYSAITNISVGLVLILISQYFDYKVMFLVIGICVIGLAVSAYFIKVPEINGSEQHKKIVFRKKYWLFYVLNFLSGARRQIFVVFSVFLLVKHYGFSVWMISALFVFNNIINIFAGPFVAKNIIKYGEKRILIFGYVFLFFVFIAYAVFEIAWVAVILYVLDNIFYNINIGIQTYFKKKADSRDIAASMAVGFTINHATAIIFPVLGGLLWMYSFRLPFLMGAVIAVVSVLFSCMIKDEEDVKVRC